MSVNRILNEFLNHAPPRVESIDLAVLPPGIIDAPLNARCANLLMRNDPHFGRITVDHLVLFGPASVDSFHQISPEIWRATVSTYPWTTGNRPRKARFYLRAAKLFGPGPALIPTPFTLKVDPQLTSTKWQTSPSLPDCETRDPLYCSEFELRYWQQKRSFLKDNPDQRNLIESTRDSYPVELHSVSNSFTRKFDAIQIAGIAPRCVPPALYRFPFVLRGSGFRPGDQIQVVGPATVCDSYRVSNSEIRALLTIDDTWCANYRPTGTVLVYVMSRFSTLDGYTVRVHRVWIPLYVSDLEEVYDETVGGQRLDNPPSSHKRHPNQFVPDTAPADAGEAVKCSA